MTVDCIYTTLKWLQTQNAGTFHVQSLTLFSFLHAPAQQQNEPYVSRCFAWNSIHALPDKDASACMISHMCARGNAIAPCQLVFVLQAAVAGPQPGRRNMSQHSDQEPAHIKQKFA